MISLPKYQPLQWIIIEGEQAFAQIINATEKTEGGWTYQVSTDGNNMQHIEEDAVLAYQEGDKWLKKSVVTTQSVYS
jgi:quinol monooxygenase YgiN